VQYHCYTATDDVPNGYGAMLLPDGTLFEGIWANGHLNDTGLILMPNGDWYEG
jgi:hypothetical protein